MLEKDDLSLLMVPIIIKIALTGFEIASHQKQNIETSSLFQFYFNSLIHKSVVGCSSRPAIVVICGFALLYFTREGSSVLFTALYEVNERLFHSHLPFHSFHW